MDLPSFVGAAASKIAQGAVEVGRGAVEFARDPANTIVEVVTGTDYNERDRVRDEQAAGNAERDQIYRDQSPLYSQVGNDFDDPVLASPEAFEAMSHQEIKAAVDAMNGQALRASAEGWKKIGESLEQSLNDFRDFMSSTIKDDTWKGIAADKATEATSNYAQDSARLAAAGKLVGSKIGEAATAIDQVKATLPPVGERSIVGTLIDRALPSVGLLKSLLHEQDEAHQEAVQIMRTVYTPVMQQADTKVPKLPAPPQVVNAPPVVNPATTGAPTGGAPNGYTPFHAPNSGSPAPNSGLPGGAPGAGNNPGADTFGPGTFIAPETGVGPNALGGPNAGADPNVVDAQTNPASAWTVPAGMTAVDGSRLGQSGIGPLGSGGAGYNSGTHGPGAGYTGTSGGSAGGGLTPGGVGSGSLGGGLGSRGGLSGGGGTSLSAASGPGAGAGGVSAGSGRPGAPGGSGMMPGAGARGRGEDDDEHKTPGYLVNVDNGNELIGKLPLAAPPVIGS
ncbi:hypothetical protein [Rhodococcus sp. ACT016]|uniref:hypothetical protein n=1 Tax=Rhodococcus sp. ACT016 TaxID=3134808 RepID=UPI003D28110F